ncbi:TPA: immunity 8 family protein [Enterobacter chengduensis]|nr:immunity 8 family protein [Enterobacter chengduensis]
MKAILRAMWIDSADFSLENYQPEEESCFSLSVNLKIGPTNEEGTNYFYLCICTPEWLCKHQWSTELVRHTLLVRKYDLVEITNTITTYINQCEGNNWMDIALKLSRVFAWEYEDYQP